MSRWIALGVIPIFTAALGLGQQHVGYSSAAADRPRGPVHTVQEESWTYQKASSGTLSGSRYTVYNEKGLVLEDFRYDADGTVLMHTKFTRDEFGRTLKRETTGADPGPTGTLVQTFDHNGLSRRETYDSNGAERDMTQIHTSPGGDTTFTMHTTNPDGSVSVAKSAETMDDATGTKHQTITKDDTSERETLVQQNAKGEPQSEAMLFFNGTSIKREFLPDGSVKSHFCHPPTRTNIYKTTDRHHRLLESVEDGPDNYSKTTYRYDEDGLMTETATFDRSGMLTGKNVMKYQLDSFGNWTEKKILSWDPKMGSNPPQLLSIIKRVISYY